MSAVIPSDQTPLDQTPLDQAPLDQTSLERAQSARIAAFIASASGDRERVGPFSVGLDPASANIWRNYAVPDAGATPSAEDIAALIALFARHDRTPRLEYVPAAAPAVEPVLLAAGFAVEGRPPLLACVPGAVATGLVPAGITIALVHADADLLDVARLQNVAYGEPEVAGPADVARLAGALGRGGLVALARDAATGEPVAAGQCTSVRDGVSELAAIATAESHRRRGIAAAVCAVLTGASHDGGADIVWLEPEGDAAERIYARVGFRRCGSKVWISRPDGVIIGGALRLHPVSAAQARAIQDGDLPLLALSSVALSSVTSGDGWPTEHTGGAMRKVLDEGAKGWLVTLNGTVIGEVAVTVERGERPLDCGLATPYQEMGFIETITAALAGCD